MGMLLRRHYQTNQDDVSDYDHLKKDELVALAVSRGIEVSKEMKKDDIIAKLKG